MVMEVKPLQPTKADIPIEVTLLGIMTEVKLVQEWKASLPIDVTPFPMMTEVRPVHFSNVLYLISITLLGITSVQLKI